MNKNLEIKLKQAVEYVKNLTPEERNEMLRKQGESWARAEAVLPKAKYRWENGVKIYDSYADSLLD